MGSQGTYLLTLSEVNVVDPLTGVRPYPDFGQVSWRGNKDNSSYQGLSVSVKRSFSRGFLFSANYMWSHEIDDGSDGSGDGDSLVPQNVACPKCERASGFWDARNVFNANAVYELPFGLGKPYLNQPGIVNAIVGNWQFTSTVVARTGFPVNVLVNRSAAANARRQHQRSASQSRAGSFAHSAGGQKHRAMDQPRRLRRAGERYLGRRAAGRGPRAGRMAD